jgi:hypothetical protein
VPRSGKKAYVDRMVEIRLAMAVDPTLSWFEPSSQQCGRHDLRPHKVHRN